MKNTGIKVIEISAEEMLVHPSKEYNQSIWKERVNRMIELGAKFFESPPDAGFKYPRFYVSYKIDGLFFLNEFSPFSPSITSRPFVKAFIINGEIVSDLFKFSDGTEGAVSKSNEGRKFLRENICNKGIMVSSCI